MSAAHTELTKAHSSAVRLLDALQTVWSVRVPLVAQTLQYQIPPELDRPHPWMLAAHALPDCLREAEQVVEPLLPSMTRITADLVKCGRIRRTKAHKVVLDLGRWTLGLLQDAAMLTSSDSESEMVKKAIGLLNKAVGAPAENEWDTIRHLLTEEAYTEEAPEIVIQAKSSRRGRKRDKRIAQRNRRIRELGKEHGITNEWAGLAELANDDPAIKALGLGQPVTRNITYNVIKQPKRRRIN